MARIRSAALWLVAAALIYGAPLLLGGGCQLGDFEVKAGAGARRDARLVVLGPDNASPRASAVSITPITSLTASGPTQKGGSTTGALCGATDRVDIKARTSSSTGTLNLVEWVPEDSRWSLTGPDASITTSLTTFRYIAKRTDTCWHVYKASGTMGAVFIEVISQLGAGSFGSIEPAASSLSLPVSVANGGTGLSSFTANRLFYSSSTSAVGQLGCSDGQVVTWASGVPACGSASSFDPASPGSIGGTTPAAITSTVLTVTQGVATSGSPTALTVTGGAHTTLAASTEAIDVNFNLARTVQFATGAKTTQRAALFQAPTYSAVGATTITNAATLAVSGAPTAGTNVTQTNSYALWVQGGTTQLDGALSMGANAGITFAAGTGAYNAGSATGDTTFGTGALGYAGASGKAISLVSTAAAVTLKSTTSGIVTVDSGGQLNLGTSTATTTSVGNSSNTTNINGAGGNVNFKSGGSTIFSLNTAVLSMAANAGITFAAGTGAYNAGSSTGDTTLGTGSVVWNGAANKTAGFTGSGASAIVGMATTNSSMLVYDQVINISAGTSGVHLQSSGTDILVTTSTGATVSTGKKLTLDSGTATGSGLAATCSKQVCVITTEALTTNAGVSETYTITNSLVTTASRPFCQGMGGTNTTPFDIQRAVPGSGSYTVKIFNSDNGSTALNGTVVFSCLIL